MDEEYYKRRKIIHVDMDAFFAAVEQRDFPEYRNKPIAVGGSTEGGVVTSASYEARKFGIHAAMPAFMALRRCPHLIFAKGRFDAYREASDQIRDIFVQYTDQVQCGSIDEAYLDVTTNRFGIASGTIITKRIKQEIKEVTGLTASAGVSYCKFLAKIGSDFDKPDGLTVIPPERAEEFLEKLPIGKFRGFGKVTAERLRGLGIHTGWDLKQLDQYRMIKILGKAGPYYYRIVRGIDRGQVKTHHIRKSVGSERTFRNHLTNEDEMITKLSKIAEGIMKRMDKAEAMGSTVTLRIKYNDFTRKTRSKTLNHYIRSENELMDITAELLKSRSRKKCPIRLLGISISNLNLIKNRYCGDQTVLNL